jgi:Type IX secretion system protein PorV
MKRLVFLTFVIGCTQQIAWAQPNGARSYGSFGVANAQQTAGAQASGVPGLIGQDSTYKPITTAVPFLSITPDARAAGLGDAGVATSPDANSAYWNAAKLVFVESKYGISFSYTPWLAKIINDMYIVYLTGYYKISRQQAVAVSMKYFDMGDVNLRDQFNIDNGRLNPRDFSFDATYSRLLNENLSIGGTIRYVQSNLLGSSASGNYSGPGKSVAVDLGIYYTKQMVSKNSNLSLGATVTNIGSKMSYTGDNKDFIPGNMRIGGAYKMEVNPLNTFTFILDFNKLLVPSPKAGSRDKSLLSGTFGSFGDASGGFREEMQEIATSAGVEYWYNKMFAGRVGYFYEAREKGNRKYFTVGVGLQQAFSLPFGVDLAYMVPTNRRESALAETLRITLHFIPKLKDQVDSVPNE